MIDTTSSRVGLALSRGALIALGCAFSLAIVDVPKSRAGVPAAVLQPRYDNLPALPLSGTFEKEDGDNGPYGLVLKNTSGNPIRASGRVFLNVASSANRKTRDIPEHVVERAETWTIYALSSGDRVTIEADGFTPLALTVP